MEKLENTEEVYAVLYKITEIDESKKTYIFNPYYVVNGRFDNEEGIFIDSNNKKRYTWYDQRIIYEKSEYCIGMCFTDEQLKRDYPECIDKETRLAELFKDARACVNVGKYDEELGHITFTGISYKDFDKMLDPNMISEEYTSISNSDTSEQVAFNEIDAMNFYEKLKKNGPYDGKEIIAFTIDDMNKILSLKDDKVLEYIKSNDNKLDYYKKYYDNNGKIIIFSEDELLDLLNSKNFSKFRKSLESNKHLLETGVMAYTLDFNDIMAEFDLTSQNILLCVDVESIRNELSELIEICNQNYQAALLGMAISPNLTSAAEFLEEKVNNLKEIVKLNDARAMREEYEALYSTIEDEIIEICEEIFLENESKKEYVAEESTALATIPGENNAVRELSVDDVNKAVDEAMEKLNSLIGLDNVKEIFDSMFSTVLFNIKTKDNLAFEEDSKHMVFTGNPGTGKTTVAEILGPFLHKVGYLNSSKVGYISAQDLIAGYVGQTAPKTEKLIKKYRDGLIVLDEAYVLAGKAQEFGGEAIAVILKEMEKNRTMFIFAGYENEMKDFIKMNSGIKSRIGTYAHFKDYSEDELYKIFKKMVNDTVKDEKQKYRLIITDEATKKIKELIHDAKEIKDFGNGRFVKNLFNMIRKEHSKNTKKITNEEELYLITDKDVPDNALETMFFDTNNSSLYSQSRMGFKHLVKKS